MTTFRPLTLQDLDAYYHLRLESLETSPEMFATDAEDWKRADKKIRERHLQLSETRQAPILGCWQEQQLIALVGIKRDLRPTVRHKAIVWGLYVTSAFRQQGVGQQLLGFAVDTAKELEHLLQLRAVVTASNQDALKVFIKCGFREYGLEPKAKFFNSVFHDEVYVWRAL